MAKGGKRKAAPGDVATNRQASFRYNLLERFEAGLVLTGTEVKSLRESGGQLKDAYAVVRDGEVWLMGMYIAPYGPASRDNHEPERTRKLLLNRREIDRLVGRTHEKGLTLVPTRVYFSGARFPGQGGDRAGQGKGRSRQARRHPPRGRPPGRWSGSCGGSGGRALTGCRGGRGPSGQLERGGCLSGYDVTCVMRSMPLPWSTESVSTAELVWLALFVPLTLQEAVDELTPVQPTVTPENCLEVKNLTSAILMWYSTALLLASYLPEAAGPTWPAALS